MSWQAWTTTEERYMIKYAKILTKAQIAENLGRTLCSIKSKGDKMGLDMKKEGQYNHKAKLTDIQAEMIRVLDDYGFRKIDIHAVFKDKISYHGLQRITRCEVRTIKI